MGFWGDWRRESRRQEAKLDEITQHHFPKFHAWVNKPNEPLVENYHLGFVSVAELLFAGSVFYMLGGSAWQTGMLLAIIYILQDIRYLGAVVRVLVSASVAALAAVAIIYLLEDHTNFWPRVGLLRLGSSAEEVALNVAEAVSSNLFVFDWPFLLWCIIGAALLENKELGKDKR